MHALDPRAKILATAGLVLGLFLVDSIAGFLVVAVAVAALLAASGIPAGVFLRILRPVVFIVALTVLFQVLFSREGATLVEWGPLEIHAGGLRLGLFLGLRILLLVSAAGLLTATTAPVALADGIEDLLSPRRRLFPRRAAPPRPRPRPRARTPHRRDVPPRRRASRSDGEPRIPRRRGPDPLP